MKNVETLIKEAMSSTDSTQGLKQWAANNGATKQGTTDAVREVLTNAGYSGSIQDQWDAFLDGLGYTGDLTQKLRLFWLDGGNVGFDPLSLFASGEEGAWYDPSDLNTLFQDAAGTVPVTADSQPVRLMLDKSGNDNHATAPSDAARPLYKTAGGLHWLEFDGVDDHFLLADSLTAPNALTASAAYTPTGADWVLVSRNSNNPWVGIGQSGSALTTLAASAVQDFIRFDGAAPAAATRGAQFTASQSANVVLLQGDTQAIDVQRIGSYQPGGFPGIGDIYQWVQILMDLDAEEISALESYMARKVGATL